MQQKEKRSKVDFFIMNYDKFKKLSKILLIAYICLLVFACVKYIPVQEDFDVKYYTIADHLEDGSLNEYLKYLCILLGVMIPIGVLVPFSSGHKCRNTTYCIGIIIILVFDISRFIYFGGNVGIDEFIITFMGVVIGYLLHKPISKIVKFGTRFQWTKESKKKGWIVYLLLVMALMVAYINIDSIGDFEEPSIYDVTYESLKNYQTSITYSGMDIDSETVHNVLWRVLREHPEIFWVPGGGRGTFSDNGVVRTYWYHPIIYGDINKIPSMEDELMACADDLISKCPEGSEYDKALWVHDMLVSNIEYDVDVFYINMFSADENTPYDYAYTAYGALINRKAVCAGYAKAYQLILNRMGIECGYITGDAVNDLGLGPHAWNYAKLDGNYYQIDVTWDDPVCLGYTNNTIQHDYFALTDEEMVRDHFADPGLSIPVCAGGR